MKFAASQLLSLLLLVSSILTLSACSAISSSETPGASFDSKKFLSSGTIILSHSLPERSEEPVLTASLSPTLEASPAQEEEEPAAPKRFAPLIGYFPPAHAYLPADNETWLEIDSSAKTLTLFKGKSPIKEISGEGDVSIGSGDYYLQHKQKQPLWYAPDEYFARRKLAVPKPGDRLRYRRGALGKYALYPTTTFPIHCGPIWSKDVGGLRVSAAELSSIYYMLPVGAPIVVK